MINFAGIYNNRYNMKYGFVRVAAAIPIVKVADCKFNAQQIETPVQDKSDKNSGKVIRMDKQMFLDLSLIHI